MAAYLGKWWSFASVGRGKGEDILNVPFDCEVKARSGFQPKQVLAQIKARTDKSGKIGFGVLRLNGQGSDVREYAAIIRFEDLVELLIKAGYNEPPYTMNDLNPVRCDQCGEWMIEGAPCFTCLRKKQNDANV